MKSNLIIFCLAVVLINAAGKSFGQNADLSIAKSDGVTTVTAGDGITRTYTITVMNNGPSQANNVSVMDTWPIGFTQGTMAVSPGTTNAQGGNFLWSIGTMAVGGVATLTVSYTVPSSTQAGSQTNTATVTSNEADPTPGNNTATDLNTVVTSADLSITKSDGVTTVTAGDGVVRTYTITVVNNGLSQADNVSVTDDWPVGFTQGTLPGNVTPGSGGNFTWNIGSLAAGASTNILVTYTVPSTTQAGSQTNTAVVSSSDPDPTPGNNSASDENTVSASGSALTITCPANISVIVDQNCRGVFTLTANTVTVTGSPTPTINYNWTIFPVYPPGSTQGSVSNIAQSGPYNITGPAGGISITATAVNSSGTATCNFSVALVDNVAPVVVCNNRTAVVDDECSVDISYGFSVSDNCQNASPIIYSSLLFNDGGLSNGGSAALKDKRFHKGVYYDTIRVQDFSGNVSTCPYTITVEDRMAPVFVSTTCQNITINTSPTSTDCGAVVNFFPVARDNCDGLATVTTNIPSGSVFPIGNTSVLAIATDGSGNTAQCNFNVTVRDGTRPTITCPANQIVYSGESCFATPIPDYRSLVTVSDNCTPSAAIELVQDVPVGYPIHGAGAFRLVTITGIDAAGNSSSCSFTVTAIDTVPPTITCPNNITKTLAAGQCTVQIPNSEITGGSIFAIDARDNCTSPSDINVHSPDLPQDLIFHGGISYITWIATDASGNSTSCSQTITVLDEEPPTISNVSASPVMLWPPNHQMKDVTVNYTSDDCAVVNCRLEVSSNEPINGTGDGDTSPDWEVIGDHHVKLRAERAAHGDGRIYTITIICSDEQGNETRQTVTVTVAHNITAPLSGQSFKIGSVVNFTGTFWDKPSNNHSAKWLIDGNTSVKGIVTEPSGSKNGKVTGSYKFTTPGVYKLQMNVTDQNGVTSYANTNGDLEAIVVIYDPNGGYTYGGGFYNSTAGALVSNPSSTGKASYGFTMNYFKNSTNPKGETQFEFKVGDFEFNALNFDYLVISNSMAQFKGTGKTIGGQSGIGFTMTVTDGQLDGTGVDKIRMKIYNKNNGKIIYDNQPGASDAALPTQPVGANSIVVISGTNASLTSANTNQKAEMEASVTEVSNGLDVIAFPNPSASSFRINVKANSSKEKITMQVVDMYGRIIETRNVNANSTVRFGDRFRPGTYFVRIIQGKEHKEMKLVKLSD